MMLTQCRDISNKLLSALPAHEYQRIQPHLEVVQLSRGKIINEAGAEIDYVYFLNEGAVSLISTTESGETVEVGVIGDEGAVDPSVLLGVPISPYRIMVQTPGTAVRMRTEVVKDEFSRCGPLHNMLLRYMHALLTQISQSAVCHRFHTVEQRLCRWLLVMHDRARQDVLEMTQELLAEMLGVRRPGVTVAAGVLQDAGIIKYSRGKIHILNREGLEKASCECYRIVKEQFDKTLSP